MGEYEMQAKAGQILIYGYRSEYINIHIYTYIYTCIHIYIYTHASDIVLFFSPYDWILNLSAVLLAI